MDIISIHNTILSNYVHQFTSTQYKSSSKFYKNSKTMREANLWHGPILKPVTICFHPSHLYIVYCSCTVLPSYFWIAYHVHFIWNVVINKKLTHSLLLLFKISASMLKIIYSNCMCLYHQ